MTTLVGSNHGRYGSVGPPGRTYVVRSRDTISAIAKRNGITIDQIVRANPTIKDPDRIPVGQIIGLPDAPRAAALAMPKAAGAPGKDAAARRELFEARPPVPKIRRVAGPPASGTEAPSAGGASTGFFARLGQQLGSLWGGLFPSQGRR